MNKKKNFFVKSMCSNGKDGKASAKRIITALAFLMMCMGFVANLFWGKTVSAEMYQSMMWIVIGGLGFTATEHFGKLTSTDLAGSSSTTVEEFERSVTGSNDEPIELPSKNTELPKTSVHKKKG